MQRRKRKQSARGSAEAAPGAWLEPWTAPFNRFLFQFGCAWNWGAGADPSGDQGPSGMCPALCLGQLQTKLPPCPAPRLATPHVHSTRMRPPALSPSRLSPKSRNQHVIPHGNGPRQVLGPASSHGWEAADSGVRALVPPPLSSSWLILFGRLSTGCWWPVLRGESPSCVVWSLQLQIRA